MHTRGQVVPPGVRFLGSEYLKEKITSVVNNSLGNTIKDSLDLVCFHFYIYALQSDFLSDVVIYS